MYTGSPRRMFIYAVMENRPMNTSLHRCRENIPNLLGTIIEQT